MMKTIRRVVFLLSVAVLGLGVLSLFVSTLNVPLKVLGLLLISALVTGIVTAFMEARSWQLPTPEDPPTSKIAIPTVLDKVEESLKAAEEYNSRTERKVRIRIDTEDSKQDDIL
jgi:hypothetical protein